MIYLSVETNRGTLVSEHGLRFAQQMEKRRIMLYPPPLIRSVSKLKVTVISAINRYSAFEHYTKMHLKQIYL